MKRSSTRPAKSAWLFQSPDSSEINRRSTRNIGANMVAQGVRFTMQMVSTIVLARLLTPADYGLVAMVSVLVNFVGLFKDAGLAQATVQRDVITHEQIASLYWINVALAIGLGLLIMALAPVIVWIYDEPKLLGLSLVLAVPIMISGFGLQHRALLQRHMRFFTILRVELLSQLLAVCAGITAALYGLGYWSLAVMTLTLAFANNLGYIGATRWWPTFPRTGTGVRDMLRFGANLTGFNFVNYFSRNADNFLIGRFIGVAALGQYSRAYGLMILPISQINAPISSALLPALSRLQNEPEAFAELYLKWVRRIAWLTAIPIASASIWGQEVVIFLLGSEWALAGEIFEWLAVASFLQPLANFAGVLFVAKGKSREMFRYGIFSSILIVSGFVIGVQISVVGVAISYAITTNINRMFLLSYMVKQAPFTSLEYLRSISIILITSSAVIAIGPIL